MGMGCLQPDENVYFLYLLEINFISEVLPLKKGEKEDFPMSREISLVFLN